MLQQARLGSFPLWLSVDARVSVRFVCLLSFALVLQHQASLGRNTALASSVAVIAAAVFHMARRAGTTDVLLGYVC